MTKFLYSYSKKKGEDIIATNRYSLGFAICDQTGKEAKKLKRKRKQLTVVDLYARRRFWENEARKSILPAVKIRIQKCQDSATRTPSSCRRPIFQWLSPYRTCRRSIMFISPRRQVRDLKKIANKTSLFKGTSMCHSLMFPPKFPESSWLQYLRAIFCSAFNSSKVSCKSYRIARFLFHKNLRYK